MQVWSGGLEETPSTLDFDKDQSLTFKCYQFQRTVIGSMVISRTSPVLTIMR
jgi:hypothetical protein